MATSVTISNVGPFPPSFHIFDISRSVSRIELKLGGTGIEKNDFASAGVSALLQNSTESLVHNTLRHFLVCY